MQMCFIGGDDEKAPDVPNDQGSLWTEVPAHLKVSRVVADWDTEVLWLISNSRRRSILCIVTQLAFYMFGLPGLGGRETVESSSKSRTLPR